MALGCPPKPPARKSNPRSLPHHSPLTNSPPLPARRCSPQPEPGADHDDEHHQADILRNAQAAAQERRFIGANHFQQETAHGIEREHQCKYFAIASTEGIIVPQHCAEQGRMDRAIELHGMHRPAASGNRCGRQGVLLARCGRERQRTLAPERARKFLFSMALNENRELGRLTQRQRDVLARELETKRPVLKVP